jgi:hypothetical protein
MLLPSSAGGEGRSIGPLDSCAVNGDEWRPAPVDRPGTDLVHEWTGASPSPADRTLRLFGLGPAIGAWLLLPGLSMGKPEDDYARVPV